MFQKTADTQNEVTIAAFTATHIVLGTLMVGNQRTSDVLNLEDLLFVRLTKVRITSVMGKEEEMRCDFAYLNKDDICFIVPYEKETVKADSAGVSYIPKERHLVDFIIPPYEVKGYVHLVKTQSVHDVQTVLKNRFIPLTNAKAVRIASADACITNPTIIVNRHSASIYTTRTA